MTIITETSVEAVAFNRPATLGWQVVHGLDIPDTIWATLTREVS